MFLHETFLSLKSRVAEILNVTAQEIMFHFRDDLSIFIPDQQKVGCFQLYLCEKAPQSLLSQYFSRSLTQLPLQGSMD